MQRRQPEHLLVAEPARPATSRSSGAPPRRCPRIIIREASGATGASASWQVINADTGAVLKSGSGAGVITFTATSLKKITFEITSSTGTPKVAEFETYA